MAVNVSDMNPLRGATNRVLQQNWKLFLAEGIVLVLLGIAAVALPPIASLAVTLLIGWVFLISGAFGLYTTFAMRGTSMPVVSRSTVTATFGSRSFL